MQSSSISKQTRAGPGSPLSLAIGAELRRRRLALGMTQASLGRPLTRAFVCGVERGHTVPSVSALALLVDRLDVSLTEFFRGVNDEMTPVYTRGHERRSHPTSRRR